jgi:two-component system sensor histidine kinase MtrB
VSRGEVAGGEAGTDAAAAPDERGLLARRHAAVTAGASVRGWWQRLVARWRRSIQLRVVITTLVLSVLVVGLLGASLLSTIVDGLLRAQAEAATADASAGLVSAQRQIDAGDAADPASRNQLLTQVVEDLANRGGPAGLYDVVLVSSGQPGSAASRSIRASRGVDPDSVPAALRESVLSSPAVYRTYTTVRYDDATPPVPGLVVGGQVLVPANTTNEVYELYYLFPLTEQQRALDLLRNGLLVTGSLLVLLLGAIAWLVVRQVVTPVRQAARTAERFSAGQLQERMSAARGTDDIALLAASFNSMAASLQQQIERLEDLSRVQQRFVSDVSHELRTPLTTVRMAADLLHEERDSFDPAVRRSAELLQTQLDRFEALLADLLEISRFDAGAAVLEAEPVDVRDLVHATVDALAPLAEVKGSQVVLALPGGPCVAEVDARRISRVLRNLVANALEHGEGRPVEVAVAEDDHAVAVVVRDHGVGLKPGESSLVFNRFWRADPARARTTGGSGLGLSIALEDARLHNGWLQAWGEPGHGSSFRLTVPKVAGAEFVGSPLPLAPMGWREGPGSVWRPRPPRASSLPGVPGDGGLAPAPPGGDGGPGAAAPSGGSTAGGVDVRPESARGPR